MISQLNTQLAELHERFRLFGIVLFTEEHPAVIKTLRDADYCAAIDEISGSDLLVFASMLFRGDYRFVSPPPGVLAKLSPVWVEPAENKKVLPWFGLRDTRSLPLFVLFGFDIRHLFYQTHSIDQTDADHVFNSLSEVLIPVARVAARNRGLPNKELFKHAKWQVRKLHVLQTIRGFFRGVEFFRGVSGI